MPYNVAMRLLKTEYAANHKTDYNNLRFESDSQIQEIGREYTRKIGTV